MCVITKNFKKENVLKEVISRFLEFGFCNFGLVFFTHTALKAAFGDLKHDFLFDLHAGNGGSPVRGHSFLTPAWNGSKLRSAFTWHSPAEEGILTGNGRGGCLLERGSSN